ncbi:putative alpha glucosidase II subunit [Trypanosoma rangeli]|uniref:Glucosidase II subunit alpha n=1 Tax=Trypanosoma rangeli TaxID=5698 RepID=A0A3R7MQZ9_TRYRA|nr:putative alpha glucosidase II subunit [Trypanosoma rangeli]RNF09848.1 putative alpha glucosidase II subunit [Trypanosoma rangeli]|eukprot:RNF09848.1 putative alpha glucosidase II subunit [Trypanosoma rangeli]
MAVPNFSGPYGSLRLLLLLATLLVFMAVSVNSVEVMNLVSKASLNVSDYGGGVLRVTLTPLTESFYEVKDVVIREPEKVKLDSVCEGEKCSISSGLCVVTATVADDVFYASYECNGSVLTSVQLSLGSLEEPSVKFKFPSARRLYGIPEHAMDLPLHKNVTYVLYNNDAFQYKIDDPRPLYGAIPFLLAHSSKTSTGVLFLNSAGMRVTVQEEDEVLGCQWNTEGGLVDLFFFPGPTPFMVQKQHASVTGNTMLPPYFSLGYHQCRWNYRNTNDCLNVDQGFDRHNLPYDVLWLDIEHTDNKKYFTWDKHNFPQPELLVSALASKGRKLVTIKDPHVKRESGYFVHEEATNGNHYVKNAEGTEDYVGKCWPGSSSWVDFYNKRTRDWYATFFHHDRYEGGSHDVHSWVDMNEPSVFDVGDNTIARDVKHTSDSGKLVDNKYLHNMYSVYNLMSVYQGHIETSKGLSHVKRPFILTRSFFSGAQRYAAMWTGDNMAKWDHLQNSFPELLSISVSNYAFCGADIGGFFFEPDEELFVRWMQAGVFYPFMRAHAHLETKRREPWTFGETATDRIRVALALRYSLLPYLYTQFFLSHKTGSTVLRPLFYEFPHDETLYDEQYTFMFGPSLLVSPVLQPGVTEKNVTVPAGSVWYSYATGEVVPSGIFQMSVDMDSIPLFLRGGHIIPAKLRMRRSTFSARHDPFTLYVALNEHGNSDGELFVDDGESFNYETGAYIHRRLSFTGNQLTCTAHPDAMSSVLTPLYVRNRVERVMIFGYVGRPKRVIVQTTVDSVGIGREVDYEMQGGALLLRKPDVPICDDWTIILER